MRVVYERCCGLDIHKKSMVACVLNTPETGAVQRHLRTFSTMTAGLLALADWLESLQITVVAMESTGMYWRPVFNLLEDPVGEFTLQLLQELTLCRFKPGDAPCTQPECLVPLRTQP